MNTFGDLLRRYSHEVSPTKTGARWEQRMIRSFTKQPLSLVPISELNETHIAKWRDMRLKTVSTGTVRREWALLSSVCSIAVNEWKLLSNHPMKNVRHPKNPPSRDRRINEIEINQLILALPFRCNFVFLFAIETAMRLNEILSLTWADIDLNIRVATLNKTKNGQKRKVPLSKTAINMLNILNKHRAGNKAFGINAATFNRYWRKAKEKTRITDLHFHDTRHEAITRLAKKLDVLELARMVGHNNINQLLVYYNATAAELAKKLG